MQTSLQLFIIFSKKQRNPYVKNYLIQMQKKKRNISVHLNLNGLTKSLDSFLFICSIALLGKQHFRGKEGLLQVETYMSFNTEIVHTDPAQRGPITKVTITSRAALFLRSTKLCHSSRKQSLVKTDGELRACVAENCCECHL